MLASPTAIAFSIRFCVGLWSAKLSTDAEALAAPGSQEFPWTP